MKKMRICTFLLALALLVTLAGCGGAPQNGEPTGTPAPASAMPASVPEEPPAPPEAPEESPAPPEAPEPEPEVPAPEEPAPEDGTIRVATAGELLEAISPGAVIQLAPGVYNLTEYLREASDEISDYAARSFTTDGWQVEIRSIQGLTIRGAESGPVEVVAEPRYSDVLHFIDCTDVMLENVTFGHTVEQGSCEGAVLSFEQCRNVQLDSLDLYGCGTYGLEADHTVGLTLRNSIIRDCSYGILDMRFCGDVTFEDCTFRDNGGFDMLSLSSSFALFDGCSFSGNEGSTFLPLYSSDGGDSGARFERCSFDRWESQCLNEELKGHGSYVIGRDCQFKVEPGRRVVHVSDMEELIENIAPDTQIMLAPGRYNLSDTLAELYAREGGHFNESREFVRITEVYDGLALMITGVDGLAIASESGSAADTEIVTDPRYADVLRFENCAGIGIMDLTMGHTEAGDCSGNVLKFTRCGGIVLRGLDLYGCGVYGVSTNECGPLSCFDSTIRDCSYGALDLYAPQARQLFLNCVMTGSGSGGFFYAEDTSGEAFRFFRCTFGERESNSFAAHASYGAIVTEDCSWSEITEYPEYPDYEEPAAAALDTTHLNVVSFDAKVLSDEYFYLCYEIVNEQLGDVSFASDFDVLYLIFEEDGSGTLWDNETGRAFSYEMDSDYSCTLFFFDGGEASLGLYADQGGALPDSAEGSIWLALYLDEEVLWFY